MKKLLATLLLAGLTAACGSTASVATNQPTTSTASTSQPTVTPTTKSTPIPVVNVTPEPTPEPTDPPTGVKQPGETTHIVTSTDEPYLDLTVSKVSFRSSYSGDYGYVEKPDQKGYVFVQAFITYIAQQSGASYNQFDWTPYAGDEALESFASVVYGPNPDLGSGDLPKGRKASGWVVYEVPKTGRITLAYAPSQFSNDEPIVEYVLRSK